MRDCDGAPNIMGFLAAGAKKERRPFSAAFELTPCCNFSCVMCYVRRSPDKVRQGGGLLSAEQWLELGRQARDMGVLTLTLTGGEPFLHPEFWEIYSGLNKMGFLIHVLSNGSMIDGEVMEKFRLYGMPYTVKLTLYGASDGTYERVCGVKNGFSRVEKAVELLQDARVPLTMTSTIVKENAGDLQEIYRFAASRGIPIQHTTSVVRSARGAESDPDGSRFDFADFSDELTLERLEKSKYPVSHSAFALCGGINSSFWATWQGHIQLCAFMNGPYVQWEGDLPAHWEELLKKLDAISSPPQCRDCLWQEFCQRCPGILCGESGDPEKISESLCRTAKRLWELYQAKKNEENT